MTRTVPPHPQPAITQHATAAGTHRPATQQPGLQGAPHHPPALLLDGITKTYKSKAGAVDALRGVTYHFQRGSYTAVMGPSGSGKSTLLQCAAGLDKPTTGAVVLNGIPLHGLTEVALTKLRREQMGFVFQAYNLLPSLTVYDNVALPLRLTGKRPRRTDVHDVLQQVGLTDKAKRRPAELSGGQQQRVAIARALITRPAVFFADEPTGALDSTTSRQVLELLRAATDGSGQTVVMVTHDPVAAAYADRVLFLSDGLVAGSLDRGTPQQIAAAMSDLER